MAARRALLSPLLLGVAILAAAAVPGDQAAPVTAESRPAYDLAHEAPARSTKLNLIALPPPTIQLPASQPTTATGVSETSLQAQLMVPTAVTVPQFVSQRSVRPSPADIGRGRLLLERIEKGEGPSIEIAWPDEPASRQRLLQHLERCAGWTPLLLADGRLWRASDPSGHSWAPSPEQAPSGLLRDVDGVAVDDAAIASIRVRHRLSAGTLVASVERGWDARLLGGLDRLLGVGWAGAVVRAQYVAESDRLTITGIMLNDAAVAGMVDLGAVSRCER
jgi:hypothetical protein